MNPTTETILSRVESWRQTPNGYSAICPAHEDRNPSLSITEKSDRVLLHCQTGCETRDIVSKLGLQMKDLYFDDDFNRGPHNVKKPKRQKPKGADADLLDRCYSTCIDTLSLSDDDRNNLLSRGLTVEQIDASRYRTMSNKTVLGLKIKEVANGQSGLIPGMDPAGSQFDAPNGITIPARDTQGRIVALKIRLSESRKGGPKYLYVSSSRHEGGASPGSPVHVPIGTPSQSDVVRITEGELKADIAFVLSGLATISAPGIGQWKKALSVAKTLKPKTIRIAFDAEENPNVQKAVKQLAAATIAAGLICELETWDPSQGKGIDDLLASGGIPTVERIKSIDQLSGPDDTQVESVELEDSLFFADDDPHRLAAADLAHYELLGGKLAFWRDEFWKYKSGKWQEIAIGELKAKLATFIKTELEQRWRESKDRHDAGIRAGKDLPPMRPVQKVTRNLVLNVVDALASMVVIPNSVEMPSWLPDRSTPNLLSTENGLLDLDKWLARKPGSFIPHSPDWFCSTKLDYEFDDNATCSNWECFLDQVFESDREQIRALQMWFGYCLTRQTHLQKILFILGPKRSGKGTILRVLTAMLGTENVCSPTLAGLADSFGLQALVGRSVATITDARLSGRSDAAVVVERLLTVSGEDRITVNIKHKAMITKKLDTRIMIASNELPRLNDASGALASRMICVETPRSFYGKEDLDLANKLLAELPGILIWSIMGLHRLNQEKTIKQPEATADEILQLIELSSPVSVFADECCELNEASGIELDRLYRAYVLWCESDGRKTPATKNVFSRDLKSCQPDIQRNRPRGDDGRRITMYQGIELNEHWRVQTAEFSQ